MKLTKTILGIIGMLAMLLLPAMAQTAGVNISTSNLTSTAASVLGTINWNGMTLPAILNTLITVNGQTLIIETNATGGYTITTYGPQGTNSFTPPQNIGGVAQFTENALRENNPANIGYYSTNGEWDLSVAGVFAQNSGQAAAQIEVDRYGLISSAPNFGVGLAVLEGNQAGQNGTAAAYGQISYRQPIGDVAFIGALGGGYDNYTGKPMAIPKIEVEYRESAHLGQFVGVGYDFEGFGKTKTQTGQTLNSPSGLIIGGGIRYSF